MAQSLKQKKIDFASTCVDYADKTTALLRDLNEIVANWNANGYDSGGANPITQADIDAGGTNSSIQHLTPALLATFVGACQTLTGALSAPQRTNLRQVGSRPAL